MRFSDIRTTHHAIRIRIMVQTRVLELSGAAADPKIIEEAAAALRNNKLVVFPTETVYGLGCNSSNRAVVDRLYSVKGREKTKPLAFYLSSRGELSRYIDKIPPVAERLLDQLWPGPLTLLLSKRGGGKIGFRCPDNEAALSLIRESGVPLIATSANRSGCSPPISGEEAVRAMMGFADVIIKGGQTRYSGESTIVDLSRPEPVIVREGVVGSERVKKILA